MARFTALLCLAAAVSQTSAHFLLNYPSTIGFDDSLEADAPCGSFTPDFSTDNVTDYHVSGDVLAMFVALSPGAYSLLFSDIPS